MIEYVQIRQKSDRDIIGIIDGFESVIWHQEYYGTGDFELYVPSSAANVDLLQEDNYITRPDSVEVGIIEKIESTYTQGSGKMIIASGRFAKSMLDRRHIYKLSGTVNKPTILSGLVETAVRRTVYDNIINCTFDANRNVSFIELGTLAGISLNIVDENGNTATKQVSFENLLEYTDAVLQEYGLGSRFVLSDAGKLQYIVYQGADRSADNTAGNEPVIFSQDYDNLYESDFARDVSTKKTAALIGGEGEGLERFYSIIAGTATGAERREMWVDAQSVSRKYKDEQDVEHEYTDAEYKKVLNTEGRQKLSENKATELFNASIDTGGGMYRLNTDFFVGDKVTFQDNSVNVYASATITEVTEVQDDGGYTITPVFDL